MADYPSPVRDRALSELNGATSPAAVNYPADVAADDKLILWLAGDTAQTYTVSGWTELDQVSGPDSFGLFWKDADGTEGGTTFNVEFTTDSRDISAVVWAVPADGDPESSSIVTSTDANITVPALSPSGGDRQYLWLITLGANDTRTWLQEWPDELGGWYSAAAPGGSVVASIGEMVKTASTHGLGTIDQWATSAFCGIATLALPVTTVSVSGYPAIGDLAESGWTSSATSQTLNLPSNISAGDYLIAAVSVGDDRTPSLSGWTTLGTHNQDVFVRTRVFAKVADGSEGATATVTLDASGRGSAWVRRLEGVDDTKTEVAFNSQLAASVDFPSLTPAAGEDKILWIVGAGMIQSFQVGDWPLPIFENPSWIRTGTNESDVGSLSQLLFEEAATLHPATVTAPNNRNVAYVIAVYPVAVPSAPTNPAATALSSSSIRVTWDDVADETGYRVERSDDGSSDWTDVSGNLAADTTQYDDGGLSASTQYFYRVFAFNGGGDSPASSTVNATTDAGGGGNRMGGTGAIRKPPRS